MNITYIRVFLGILGHYSIQYLNFAKKWFNSLFNSKNFKKIQFKKIFNSKICKKIQFKKIFNKKNSIQKNIQFKNLQKNQFKIWFKMLNLAGFNSTIYSFNNKLWVSLTPSKHLANGLLYPDLVSEIGASAGSAHEQDRLISCGASQGCDLGL